MRRKSEMHAYQHRVADYFYENSEAFGVLKMGAGKTISTLTAVVDLIEDKVIRHVLIVAPKRVASLVWPAEIANWEHTRGLHYAVLEGGPSTRLEQLLDADVRHVTIVGIDNVQWMVDIIEDWPANHPIFDALVIDETSKLKNPKSKRAKAFNKIAKRFRNKWGLTGTPRPNSLMDLFTPAKILTGGRLWGNSFYKWQKEHFYPLDFKQYKWAVIPGHEDGILADAASISVALGEHEMPELPSLTILEDQVILPPAARNHYRDMEERLFTELEGADILAVSQAVATGKLAQMANGFLYDEDGAGGVHPVHDEKAQWLEDLVDNLNGEPLIVIYEYKEDLAMLRRLFGSIPYLGAGVSDQQAKQHVEAWNRSELPVFALHPASGGHGLNLQHGGSRMAWIAPTWSAELWDQTLARIHRPGQAAHCMVHVCCAAGTVDDLKRLRVIQKLSAQQAYEAYLAACQPRRRAA